MLTSSILRFTTAALLPYTLVTGLDLDPTNADSIKEASSQIAYGLVKYYNGNETGDNPGRLPAPYYWWLGGAMFGELIEYWYYTGDAQYNDITIQGLQAQIGENKDYQPKDVTAQLGNDDQAFWAFSCLTAAELKFPDPPAGDPGWLELSQAVFNRQASRWDTATCNGGLRWQVFFGNNGYDYKNSVSNGAFFQIAARLYRYTGNETYNEWAEKIYDWMDGPHTLISEDYHVYDGTKIQDNCTTVWDNHEWTYNVGMFVAGCAYMYNKTQDEKWSTRLTGFLKAAKDRFFPYPNSVGPVLVEVGCETVGTCNNEQPSFKGYLARWMVLAAQLVPTTHDFVMPLIRASAVGAAAQCSGGSDGITCGMFYNQTTWDGDYGVGQQMSALAVVQALMLDVKQLEPPITGDTGGTSQGNPSAGTDDSDILNPFDKDPVTTGDRAGAGILTAFMLMLTVGGVGFMLM